MKRERFDSHLFLVSAAEYVGLPHDAKLSVASEKRNEWKNIVHLEGSRANSLRPVYRTLPVEYVYLLKTPNRKKGVEMETAMNNLLKEFKKKSIDSNRWFSRDRLERGWSKEELAEIDRIYERRASAEEDRHEQQRLNLEENRAFSTYKIFEPEDNDTESGRDLAVIEIPGMVMGIVVMAKRIIEILENSKEHRDSMERLLNELRGENE